jgi:Zn finger protein HypA/HybF involved in hydrogenase expression
MKKNYKKLGKLNIKYSIEEIFCKNSPIKGERLKRLLINNFGVKEQCDICKVKDWNEKHISLSIHHINGDSKDNRLENLQLLCPNCHSQTENFAGKRLKKIYHCLDCGKMVVKNSKSHLCVKCSSLKKRKVIRPDKDVLFKEIKELGFRGTGNKYGVSDVAIRKWVGLKSNN